VAIGVPVKIYVGSSQDRRSDAKNPIVKP
jgi:hypothetical protein